MSLIAELRRRKVFRVAAGYLVAGWLLTEVLTTILPTVGAPEWMPRAVVLVFAMGFVPAVVLSWFFELTPEGIKREKKGFDAGQGGMQQATDYLIVGGVIVLIIVVGLFSARHTGESTAPQPVSADAASVAVLPFANLSNDDDNEYFSDGLAETLMHMLTQVPDLKVAAKSSSFAFRDQQKTIREIAAALGVAHVLEGSVQRSGNQVRITTQLIRASDGFQVWSSRYDRTLDDIFGIQDEIARKVGFALTESLLGSTAANLAGLRTESPDAYDLYLQALKQRATYSYGGLQAAEDLLKGALLIDPEFVEAKTALASGYVRQVETGLMSPAEAFPQVLAITRQVLDVAPDNTVARALNAYAQAHRAAQRGEPVSLDDLAKELQSLVAGAPGELEPRIVLVRVYEATGQDDKAVAALEEALERDPYNPQVLYELGTALYRQDRPTEARNSLAQSLEIEPAQPNAHVYLALIAADAGDGVAYVEHVLDALEVDPRDQELPGMLASFLYELGLIEEGDDFRARVQTIAPTSEIAYRTELLRAIAAGDEAAADASARRAISDGVSARQFAFGGAVQHLLRSAIESGTLTEEIRWIEQQHPGIFDVSADAVPARFRSAQRAALDAWYVSDSPDVLERKLDALLDATRAMGLDPKDDPFFRMNVLALRGDVQAAVRVALDEIFSRSVASHLGWERTFEQAQYGPLVADPRVQDAMNDWRAEAQEIRQNVAAYLADLQAHS